MCVYSVYLYICILWEVCVCVCVCVCVLGGYSFLSQDYLQLKEILHPRICQRPPWKLCVLQEPRKGFWFTVSFHALMHLLKACSLPVSSPVQLNQRFSKFPLSASLGLGPEGDTPEWEKVCVPRETGTLQASTEEALKELLRSWVRGHFSKMPLPVPKSAQNKMAEAWWVSKTHGVSSGVQAAGEGAGGRRGRNSLLLSL